MMMVDETEIAAQLASGLSAQLQSSQAQEAYEAISALGANGVAAIAQTEQSKGVLM